MATVLDQLIVTLGLDSRLFASQAAQTQATLTAVGRNAVAQSKALEEVLKKTQDSTDKRLKQGADVGKQAVQNFNKFRVEVVGLFAALATGFGLEKFIRGISSAEAGAGRLSRNLGLSVQELSLWQNMAKLVGGTGEEIGTTFTTLTDQFNKWKTVGGEYPEFLKYFSAIKREGFNDSLVDANNNLLAMPELIEKMRGMLAANPSSRSMKNTWLTDIGFDPATRNLMLADAKEFADLMAKASKMNILTPADVEAAKAAEQTLIEIGSEFDKLKTQLLTEFGPEIKAALEGIRDWLRENAPEIKKNIHEMVGDVKPIVRDIDEVVKALGGWKVVTEGILALWVVNKFENMTGILTGLLKLLAFIPGSGVSVATLAALGIGIPGAIDIAEHPFGNIASQEDEDKITGHAPTPGREPHTALTDMMNQPAGLRGRLRLLDGFFSAMSAALHEALGFSTGDAVAGATDERKAAIRDKIATGLGVSGASASGIVSGLNAESGIAGINERNPTVPGSRGGFGWAQWTGPRRIEMESYARLHGLDPASDEANYGFLIHSLTNNPQYAGLLAQLRSGSISAYEAATIFSKGYIVPPDATLGGHVAGAEGIARLPSAAAGGVPHAAFDPSLLRGGSSPNARVASAVNDNSRSNTSSSNVDIGTLNINTNSNDPQRHAQLFVDQSRRLAMVAQANSGLS
jgi:hypothetical protein